MSRLPIRERLLKITAVEVVHLRIPSIAHEANGTQDAAIVRVSTDEGITGIGEECATVHEFRDLIERGHLGVLQPDVARVGGITEAMRISALAYAQGKPVVPHMFSTDVLFAASVHVNASIPNMLFQETVAPGEGSELNTRLVHPPATLDADGCVVIPTGPGLGIELDQAVIDMYRVA